MGYAKYGLPNGQMAGYGIADVCHENGCDERIDRGLGYLCGDTPGGDEYGCGGYFCDAHLYARPDGIQVSGGGVCVRCRDALAAT